MMILTFEVGGKVIAKGLSGNMYEYDVTENGLVSNGKVQGCGKNEKEFNEENDGLIKFQKYIAPEKGEELVIASQELYTKFKVGDIVYAVCNGFAFPEDLQFGTPYKIDAVSNMEQSFPLFNLTNLITGAKAFAVEEFLTAEISRLHQFEYQLSVQRSLFIKKNNDYGDSFAKTVTVYGMKGVGARFSDKYYRLESLITGKDIMVNDEKINDTLMDMSNYAGMSHMLLEYPVVDENGNRIL